MFTADTIKQFLNSRGVCLDYIERYLQDYGHGFAHSVKVFTISEKLLHISEENQISELLPSLAIASVLHDFTGLALEHSTTTQTNSLLDQIYPKLQTSITSQVLDRFLVLGENGINKDIYDHFQGLMSSFLKSSDETTFRKYHHLTGAVLAYILLKDKSTFGGEVVDPKHVALAVLSHTEMNPTLVPRHLVIDILMDADTLSEFDINRMIEININQVKRPLFDGSIPWEARREMLIDQRDGEPIELDHKYGRTGRWLDTFEYTIVKLVSNLTDRIYRNPKAVLTLLSRKNELFDKAIADTFGAIQKYTKSNSETLVIYKAMLDLIKEARTSPQYQPALELLGRLEQRIGNESIPKLKNT
jgi:hypothetical protein